MQVLHLQSWPEARAMFFLTKPLTRSAFHPYGRTPNLVKSQSALMRAILRN